MYNIQKMNYGYKITFGDFMDENEMKNWFEASKVALQTAQPGFGTFIDMRTLKPLTPEAQKYMQEGQKLWKEKGMIKSVVILANSITTMQFKRIAKETGIYQWERYIDATTNQNWEKAGIDWVQNGIDPDK
ncbi:MAG: hypothetical protein FWH18_01285 [Marinilabiliaceae bacterium]|nr:hypothetical protein [Marinilabiliaceae bacterium]